MSYVCMTITIHLRPSRPSRSCLVALQFGAWAFEKTVSKSVRIRLVSLRDSKILVLSDHFLEDYSLGLKTNA